VPDRHEELHTGANSNKISASIEDVGHNEGYKEHGEDRSTRAVETLGGQLAEI
jgi:hypothetical protein